MLVSTTKYDKQQLPSNDQQDLVLVKAEAYAHAVYLLAKKLPRDELFGLTSQLQRSALSVPLNIVEGYARQSKKAELQFLRITYGSLKEAQFIIKFACDEGYFNKLEAQDVLSLVHESGRMIWAKSQTLKRQFK